MANPFSRQEFPCLVDAEFTVFPAECDAYELASAVGAVDDSEDASGLAVFPVKTFSDEEFGFSTGDDTGGGAGNAVPGRDTCPRWLR